MARQALPKDDDSVDGFGIVLIGLRDGTDAKVDVGLTKDGETVVLLTRVQQAKTGPRKPDTELRLPLESLKRALRLLAPDPPGLFLPLSPEATVTPIDQPARTPVPGVPMTADELQIGGVPVEDDFTPPS